jgi:hypothetical protein
MQPRALFVAVAALLTSVLSGCHGNSSRPATTNPKVERGVLGDTAAFGIDIVRFNGTRTRATYRLAAPGHVLLLAITPGQPIERIDVSAADVTPMRVGEYTTYLPLRRDELAEGAQRSIDQADFDRCMEDERTAAERRRPKPEQRDSTGRVISDGGGREESPMEVQRRAERMCTAQQKGRISQRPVRRPRYLALIATDSPLAPDQVDGWLESLPAPTEDMSAALTAVADGLFRDRRVAWAAAYLRWW